MGMLVAIQMGRANAGIKQPRDLSARFPFYLGFIQLAQQSGAGEGRERWSKSRAVRTQKRLNLRWRRKRISIDKNDVASDTESRQLLCKRDRVFKGCSIRHKSSGGKCTCAVQVCNAAVHATCQAEVIGVDNQPRSKVSFH